MTLSIIPEPKFVNKILVIFFRLLTSFNELVDGVI